MPWKRLWGGALITAGAIELESKGCGETLAQSQILSHRAGVARSDMQSSWRRHELRRSAAAAAAAAGAGAGDGRGLRLLKYKQRRGGGARIHKAPLLGVDPGVAGRNIGQHAAGERGACGLELLRVGAVAAARRSVLRHCARRALQRFLRARQHHG